LRKASSPSDPIITSSASSAPPPSSPLRTPGIRRRSTAIAARVALGIGSGMVLDEITFLVMTKASDDDYVSAVSLIGGIVFIGLAVILLGLLYWLRRDA
jgi:hypothetical protein